VPHSPAYGVFRSLADKRLAGASVDSGFDFEAPPWAHGPTTCQRVITPSCTRALPGSTAVPCSRRQEGTEPPQPVAFSLGDGRPPPRRRGDADGFSREFIWYACIDTAAWPAGGSPDWCRSDSAHARAPVVCLETRASSPGEGAGSNVLVPSGARRGWCTCWARSDTTGLSTAPLGSGAGPTISERFPLDRAYVSASGTFGGDAKPFFPQHSEAQPPYPGGDIE
jgi:hypothetical protein